MFLLMADAPVQAPAQVQTPAQADTAADIPAPIKAMLDAATAKGSDAEVAAVAKYADAAAPQSAAAIDKYVADWKARRQAEAQARLAQKSFFQKIKGHIELGGYVDTGTTNDTGYTGTVDLGYTDGAWTHKLHLLADYQRSLGVTTRNHYLADYEPNYRLSPRAYLFGVAQYESDRFMGFNDRYTISGGFGYSLIKRPNMTLDIEAGPAWRLAYFIDDTPQSRLAGRGAINFSAKLSHGLTFLETANAYVESGDSTLYSKTAIQARVIGPLSAQLSYMVQYESNPPPELNLSRVNTTGRASVVLDF